VIETHEQAGVFKQWWLFSNPRQFFKNRAKSVSVIRQPKSVFFRKLLNFCLPIFLVWPGASQFFLIDRAVPQLISFEPQLRPDSVGKIFHGARKRLEHANID
jgi:hypothetical protein